LQLHQAAHRLRAAGDVEKSNALHDALARAVRGTLLKPLN
jgi:hypothetical protein